MRIISGSAKGRKLFTPKSSDIRPTSDRVKEAIFNILMDKINNVNIIDVFAGTGNLGIEALSRGAKHAYFVESKREAIGLIRRNLDLTGLIDKATILDYDAEKATKRLENEGVTAEVIFLDPPYRISVSFLSAVISSLSKHVLTTEGLLVLEHASKTEPPSFDGLNITSTRKYGDTAVTFYEKEGTQ
jgi:16S rRNA (guanine(966)-N(2))-methyltransferase RsmD